MDKSEEWYNPELVWRWEVAERVQKPELPPAQYGKGIDVDDRTYLPGEGLHDWAEEFFYNDMGGES